MRTPLKPSLHRISKRSGLVTKTDRQYILTQTNEVTKTDRQYIVTKTNEVTKTDRQYIGNTQISILLLCFLYLFVELMIMLNE